MRLDPKSRFRNGSMDPERLNNERDESEGGVAADPDYADLVAYLDGELSEEAVARVERRLADDERFRQHLASLQRSWDALGSIPPTVVNENFTRSTLEMVAVSISDSQRRETTTRRWRLGVAWVPIAAAIGVAGVIGFFAIRYQQQQQTQALLKDLPVIERVDLYRNVGDIDFLVRLADEGLFQENLEATDESSQ